MTRIALNAQLLSFSASYRQAGISRLIHATIQGLQAVDQQHDYVVFAADRSVPAGYITNRRWRVAVSRLPTTSRPLRIFWEQAVLPWSVLSEHADLLHALAFVGPLVSPRPQVVTIYDLSFLLYPAVFNRLNRWYLSLMAPLSVRRARRVIAISESTKRDLVRLAHVPVERIDVVYPALEPGIRRVEDSQSVSEFRRRRHLPERFIMFLGTLEPRKNVAALIQAYSRLRRRGLPLALVLAGSKGWRYEEIFAAIEDSGVAEDIVLPGYVTSDELPLWYSAAEVFVYPSLYEGFGLPVLEAMACGTPVITSNVSSLPEVAGEAAILLDPVDVDALADAINRVVHSVAIRGDMQARGIKQASKFTLERMARATCAVYDRALVPSLAANRAGK